MTERKVPAVGNVFERILPSRYMLAILGSIGMAIIYGLKVNLSVAIVSMVNHTATPHDHPSDGADLEDCAAEANQTTTLENNQVAKEKNPISPARNLKSLLKTSTYLMLTYQFLFGNIFTDLTYLLDGPFLWSPTLQGAILSSYFWGYIVAQLPGGRIAELFSAKWVMFFSVAINVICTLLTPLAANLHYGTMLAVRIGEGIGGGVTFPAMHVMLANWAPPTERSVMSSIVYAGTSMGTVISMLLSGVIAAALGWESVFYIMGGLSVIWMILWVFLIGDSPEKQRFISQKEREFITNALSDESGGTTESKGHPAVPWKSVATSTAFWAILVAHTCSNWGWYMVLIELPLYMKTILKFKISENAVLTAIPFFCMFVFSMVLSKILDTLRAKNIISTTFARKAATLIASVVPASCFIALCYIGCMRSLAVALMTIAIMSIGAMFSGFLTNHIDIAPNYAGTLMALTNTVATIPGIVVPIFVGELTGADPSITSWRIIFFTTVGLYVIEILMFTIFGSGEEQKWNKIHTENSEAQPLKSSKKGKV